MHVIKRVNIETHMGWVMHGLRFIEFRDPADPRLEPLLRSKPNEAESYLLPVAALSGISSSRPGSD